jgi:hypothetical protein
MIKGNRTLEWQKHIGTVELEIEHDGHTLNLTVSPVQATIIYHFQEKGNLKNFCTEISIINKISWTKIPRFFKMCIKANGVLKSWPKLLEHPSPCSIIESDSGFRK